MVGEAPGFWEAGRMHENKEPELLDPGEDLAEALGREILAGDVSGDLDAAKTQGFMDPVQFGDREVWRLKRYGAERNKAAGVAPGNVGEVVVDGARGGESELGVGAVIGLVRRGRDRLDVYPHPVHVREPFLDRGELDASPFGLLPVDLARALVGEFLPRVPRRRRVARDHLRGLRGQHVTMDVDGEPFAACTSRPRKTARNLRPWRQTFEQHHAPSSVLAHPSRVARLFL